MDEEEFCQLTYTDEHHTISIRLPRPCGAAEDFVESLLRPMMYAAGFHPDTVRDTLEDPT
jgi:hypothetical protein